MIYTMPSAEAAEEAFEDLARRYRVRREAHPTSVVTYYDTFDWRLHADGGTLLSTPRESRKLLVWRHADGSLRHRLLTKAVPGFSWDFPPGALRGDLEPILEMRRLLPILELETVGETLHVLDDEEKTVARVRLRRSRAGVPGAEERNPLPATLRLEALRGYDTEHEDVRRRIEENLGLEPSVHDELAAALGAVGRYPGDYSSKIRLELDAGARSDIAAASILHELFATMLRNEDGTRRDLDSEFLHDFRVAVRRTRSALTQIPRVFPAQVVEHFRNEFKWLGSITGPTRDMDVYLLKMDAYEAALPEEIRGHLEPLRRFLVKRQRGEQRRLVRRLDSLRYGKIVRAWRQFLEEASSAGATEEATACPNASRPIRELASERIWKAWRRVWKKGRVIRDETPAEAFHKLRIDCKKLRYLLEFFRSLYPTKKIDGLVRALKQLQDNLGDFNDLEVQQEKLRELAHEMSDAGAASVDTLLATGELVTGFRLLQEKERRKFADRFARFSAPPNRQTFRDLFNQPGGGRPQRA